MIDDWGRATWRTRCSWPLFCSCKFCKGISKGYTYDNNHQSCVNKRNILSPRTNLSSLFPIFLLPMSLQASFNQPSSSLASSLPLACWVPSLKGTMCKRKRHICIHTTPIGAIGLIQCLFDSYGCPAIEGSLVQSSLSPSGPFCEFVILTSQGRQNESRLA